MSNPKDFDAITQDLDKLFLDLRRCLSCKRLPQDITKENCCSLCKPKPKYPDVAPEGTIYVCGACGKTSKNICGDEPENSLGWDESCMLNAVLCFAKSLEETGRWVAVEWES